MRSGRPASTLNSYSCAFSPSSAHVSLRSASFSRKVLLSSSSFLPSPFSVAVLAFFYAISLVLLRPVLVVLIPLLNRFFGQVRVELLPAVDDDLLELHLRKLQRLLPRQQVTRSRSPPCSAGSPSFQDVLRGCATQPCTVCPRSR